MRNLYLRIYATVVVVLLLFAAAAYFAVSTGIVGRPLRQH